MGKLTSEVFNESCCDGGACATTRESAEYCGCDKGANWICQRHREESEKVMTTQEYEAHVLQRSKVDLDLNYAVVALNGEAGEVAEWHKKYNLRGNPNGDLSDVDLLLELGDVQFYLTRLAALKGWTLSDVMRANIDKLENRRGAGLRRED